MRFPPLVLLLALGVASAAGAADFREDLAAIERVIDAAHADLLRRRQAAGYHRLDLVCAGAIDRQREQPNFENPPDLVLSLVREDDRWTPGLISIPGYTPGMHELAVDELQATEKDLTGTVRVTIDPRNTSGGYGGVINYKRRPDYAEPLTFTVELSGKIGADGKIAGRYLRRAAHGFPEAGDELGGILGVPASDLPALPPLAEAAPATAGELRALELHRRCLLVEWMTLNRAGIADALATIPPPLLPEPGRDETACRATIRRVRELVEQLPDRLAAPVEPIVGNPPMVDPDFGPFVDVAALPSPGDGENDLVTDPRKLTTDHAQEWRAVGSWQVLGPVPRNLDEDHRPPSLPDHVVLPAATYQVLLPQGRKRPPKQATATWQAVEPLEAPLFVANGGSGGWTRDMGYGHWISHGFFAPDIPGGKRGALKRCGYWATATVTTDAASELYLATGVKTHRVPQRLWLNDRLVWTSLRAPDPREVGPAIFKVKLQEGANHFLIHSESSAYEGDLQPFTVSFCTAGAPRDAATVAAHRAKVAAKIDELLASRAHVKGLLTNWVGRHPAADPPLAWDVERDINVRWNTRLAPAHSNVVVVGDRVFTTGDPHHLYCLDAATGKIRWRRECDIFELLHPDKQAEAKELRAAAEAAGEVIARNARLKRAAMGGDEAAQAAHAAMAGEYADAQAARRRWESYAKKHVAWGKFPWWHSPAWASPVTDGEHVWVKFGTGVVACFDLVGERRWMIDTGAPRTGTRPSPVLVDDVLVIMVPLAGSKSDMHDNHPGRLNFELIGLAADTGETLWRQPVWAMGNEGSPIPVPVSDGEAAEIVVVTPCGTVVRPRDGQVLRAYTGQIGLSYQTPLMDRDQIVWAMFSGSVCSGRFLLDGAGRLGYRPLWRSVSAGMSSWQGEGRYQMLHGGISYRMGCRRGSTSNMPWHEGAMVDLVTGREIERIQPIFHGDGGSYVPHSQAGDFLFFGKNDRLAVVTTGRHARVVARNVLPRAFGQRSAATFAGDAMYLRNATGLVCLAIDDERGRRYQEDQLARHLLDHLGSPPAAALATIVDLPPLGDTAAASIAAPWDVRRCTAPGRWLFAGPFPRVEDDDLATRVAGPGSTAPTDGREIEIGGERRAFAPLPAEHISARAGYSWAMGIGGHTERADIDVLGAIGGKPETTSLYYAPLHTSRPCVIRSGMGNVRYARLYVNGVELARDRLYRLPRGRHHLLLRIDFSGTLPAGIKLYVNPRIYQVGDPARRKEAWVARVRRVRPEMERSIAALGEEHPLSRQFAFILAYVEREGEKP